MKNITELTDSEAALALAEVVHTTGTYGACLFFMSVTDDEDFEQVMRAAKVALEQAKASSQEVEKASALALDRRELTEYSKTEMIVRCLIFECFYTLDLFLTCVHKSRCRDPTSLLQTGPLLERAHECDERLAGYKKELDALEVRA